MGNPPREWWQAAAGGVMAFLLVLPAGVTLGGAGWAVVQPVGLDYAEPVVYGQAMRLVSGEPLYQPIGSFPFTVAAYTPLYYWLAAALQAVVGAGFGPGRLLSLVAGLAAAATVGGLARQSGDGLWVAPFAGLLFLARGLPGDVPWLGLYRVDLPGIALSLASVALLSRGSGTRTLIAAGVLAGLAVLTKQTLLAAWLAGTLWLCGDLRKAGMFFTSALCTFAVPCLLLESFSSGAFFENTFVANLTPFHASIALGLLTTYVDTQWLPVLLTAVYLVTRRPWRTSGCRLLVLYWSLSSLSLLGLAKVGANTNYWIEFAAASAILAARGALAVMNSSNRRVAAAGAAALILALSWAIGGPSAVREKAREVRADLTATLAPAPHADFDSLVDRVRHEPSNVLAEPMDVLVLGGRPVLLEPFIYNLLLSAGRWQPDPLVGRICNGQIGLVVLAYPLERAIELSDGLFTLWPAPVIAALQDTMVLDDVEADRYVYTSRHSCIATHTAG